jgi:serine/threonine protein kinase
MNADPALHDADPPRIGRYRVLRRVASGGMAAVYRAHDVVERRDVALKVLSPQWVSRPNVLERFRREARLARILDHENIVAYFDTGEDAGFHYHAMEYISGVDLRQYVANRGRLDVGESRYFVIQAVRALEHLHDHSIVHRDIKPANFLITLRDNQQFLKLIDLGLARRIGEDSLTIRPGATVGTVDFIAPEQAQDRTVADVRSDIYALGCTWYFTLTGLPPFLADTAEEKLALRLDAEDPPDVRAKNPDVPLDVVEVLNKMMARNESYRYQSPLELLHDLETLPVAGPLPRRPASTPKLPPVPPPPSRRSGVAIGIAFVLAVVGALAWYLLRPH